MAESLRSSASFDEWDRREGTPGPMGVTWIPSLEAWNFALYSRRATGVTLLLYGAEGFPVITVDKVDAAAVFEMIEKHGVTHFTAAPVVLNMLIHAPENVKRKLGRTIEETHADFPTLSLDTILGIRPFARSKQLVS